MVNKNTSKDDGLPPSGDPLLPPPSGGSPSDLTPLDYNSQKEHSDVTLIDDPRAYYQGVAQQTAQYEEALFPPPPAPPVPETGYPGTIDVARFVRAQADFIARQTHFLRTRHVSGSPEYVSDLSQYSLAQADFIAALTEILEQLKVL
jgi:hypothetical protein